MYVADFGVVWTTGALGVSLAVWRGGGVDIVVGARLGCVDVGECEGGGGVAIPPVVAYAFP